MLEDPALAEPELAEPLLEEPVSPPPAAARNDCSWVENSLNGRTFDGAEIALRLVEIRVLDGQTDPRPS